MTDDQKEELVRQTQELLAYQSQQGEEETDHPVPHLSVSDLKTEAENVDVEEITLHSGRPSI